MKTDKIFSLVVESLCPACGTPRVGIDQDDDYHIVPGRLEAPEVCGCGECRRTVITGEYLGFAVTSADFEARKGRVEAQKPTDSLCRCGHALVWHQGGTDFGEAAWVASCGRPEPSVGPRISHLAGCPKCSVSYSWPGIGGDE